jgi:5-methylthioadenosine/S-adenosylhomocysteine deaminase
MQATMKSAADLILLPQWVIPVETGAACDSAQAGSLARDLSTHPNGALLDHAVVIQGGLILDVLPTDAAQARYTATQTLPLPGQALIPGLVNLHGHAAMSLFRGFADDLPLMTWLNEHIWPAEKRLVSESFVRDGTLLAAAEMLSGGITCCNDMYFFPQAAGEAFLQAGMRATLGMIVLEFPSAYASDADNYLSQGLAMRDALKGEPLLSFAFAPHAPYTVSDATFGRINTLADQLGLPIHTHIHETADEIRDSLKQFGMRPLERLAQLGLLGPNFIGVHAVHVNDAEIGLLAQHGCHLAHCPTSNLKLASGIAPVAKFTAAGVNLGFGTDSAASNNRLDLFADMRLAALLAKGTSGNAAALPAAAALKAATLDAARALNLDDCIGSIVPGKRADLVAVDLQALSSQPLFDPVSHLVYVAGREAVTHVWVDGKLKLNERRLVDMESDDLNARAAYWRTKLAPQG